MVVSSCLQRATETVMIPNLHPQIAVQTIPSWHWLDCPSVQSPQHHLHSNHQCPLPYYTFHGTYITKQERMMKIQLKTYHLHIVNKCQQMQYTLWRIARLKTNQAVH